MNKKNGGSHNRKVISSEEEEEEEEEEDTGDEFEEYKEEDSFSDELERNTTKRSPISPGQCASFPPSVSSEMTFEERYCLLFYKVLNRQREIFAEEYHSTYFSLLKNLLSFAGVVD